MTGFKMKYSIKADYIPISKTKPRRRAGIFMPRVAFIVAHDSGNPGSTARGNVKYFKDSYNKASASAQIFVDDRDIIECIPALTGKPEKAWHVLYGVPEDNKRYGDDANDIAIGVEYCFGGKINDDEAYARYVWVMAYICYEFELDPATAIVGHHVLDPKRKIDPVNGLSYSGRTYEQLLEDVVIEYNECLISEEGDDTLKLEHDWQWEQLVTTLESLVKKGKLNSDQWVAKAKKKELTVSELAFLNIVLHDRAN